MRPQSAAISQSKMHMSSAQGDVQITLDMRVKQATLADFARLPLPGRGSNPATASQLWGCLLLLLQLLPQLQAAAPLCLAAGAQNSAAPWVTNLQVAAHAL
jgi:hypothetical protein